MAKIKMEFRGKVEKGFLRDKAKVTGSGSFSSDDYNAAVRLGSSAPGSAQRRAYVAGSKHRERYK